MDFKRLTDNARLRVAFQMLLFVGTVLTFVDIYFWVSRGIPFLPVATGPLVLIEVFEYGAAVGFIAGLLFVYALLRARGLLGGKSP